MSSRAETAGPSVMYLIDSLAAGGAERSLVDMAPRLVQNGVRLEVAVLIDRDGLAPELLESGIPVHTVGGGSRMAWFVQVLRLLQSRRPDLLHTTLFESDVVGRAAAALSRTPVVSTLAVTPYGEEHARERGIRRHRLKGAQLADAITAKAARRFHAVSRSAAEAYISRVGLDPDKVDVIPRGRDPGRLGAPGPERASRVRESLQLEASVPVILFVGRQEPAKGLDVLLNAMPAVLRDCPDAVLLVAGRSGRASEEALRIRREKQLEGSVRVLGERADVPDLLCAADVFVLPSYREGLPGAVLEAMAMEVPIIASDIPTVREAVPDESYALLVPVGDPGALSEAILRSLANREEALDRADRCRLRFEQQFDIDAVARAMTEFYRRSLRTGN